MIDFQNGQNSGWREMHNSEIQQDKSPDIIKDTKGEKEDVALPKEGRQSFLDVLDPLDLETKSFRDLTALLLSIKCHQAFFKIVIAHKVLTAAMKMLHQPFCLRERSR